jgi:hypothetical protein
MTHQSLGEVSVYGRLVATFMAYVYANVLRPIWKAYPDLEPQSTKGPYVEPVAVLAPEAEAALRSFITEASAALAYAKEALSQEDRATAFNFGGLGEVEEALREIQAFRERPRLRDEPL